MKQTSKNLEGHKALTKGYILGFQDRTKARLEQLDGINKTHHPKK